MLLDKINLSIDKENYRVKDILKNFVKILYETSSDNNIDNFKYRFLTFLYDEPLVKKSTVSFILNEERKFGSFFRKENITILNQMNYLKQLSNKIIVFDKMLTFHELLTTDYFKDKDIVKSFKDKFLPFPLMYEAEKEYVFNQKMSNHINHLTLNCFIELSKNDVFDDNYLNGYDFFISYDKDNELKLEVLNYFIQNYKTLHLNNDRYEFVFDYVDFLSNEQKVKLWKSAITDIDVFKKIFPLLGTDFLSNSRCIAEIVNSKSSLECKKYLLQNLPEGYIEKNFIDMVSMLSVSFWDSEKIIEATHLFFNNISEKDYSDVKNIKLKESIQRINYDFFKTMFNYVSPEKFDSKSSIYYLLSGFLKFKKTYLLSGDIDSKKNKIEDLFVTFSKYLPKDYNFLEMYDKVINVNLNCFCDEKDRIFINGCVFKSKKLNEKSLNEINDLIKNRYLDKPEVIDAFIQFKNEYLNVNKINKLKMKVKIK